MNLWEFFVSLKLQMLTFEPNDASPYIKAANDKAVDKVRHNKFH